MERSRDPFGVAVDAVRTRMRSGRYVLGEQLMVNELARELRLSATPVREALARLSGEGLVEDRRGVGYFAWRPDAVDLAELYDLQMAYLGMSLDLGARTRSAGPRPPQPVADADEGGPLEAVEALFLRLVTIGGSLAVRRAHRLLADRLAPARRVEALVLAGAEAEWTALAAIATTPDPDRLRPWLAAYHERRRMTAPAIVAAMRSVAGA